VLEDCAARGEPVPGGEASTYPPTLGENTADVLRNVLGCSDDEIIALLDTGAIALVQDEQKMGDVRCDTLRGALAPGLRSNRCLAACFARAVPISVRPMASDLTAVRGLATVPDPGLRRRLCVLSFLR
jgi:hypothetical protein